MAMRAGIHAHDNGVTVHLLHVHTATHRINIGDALIIIQVKHVPIIIAV